jgi:hypothetical protein
VTMERQKTAKIKADISTLVRIGHFYFGLTIPKKRIDEALYSMIHNERLKKFNKYVINSLKKLNKVSVTSLI